MTTAPRPRPALKNCRCRPVLPAAGDLSWEQYGGRACVWCDQPLTTGARSVGISRGRLGAHVLDIEVFAGACCP